MSLEIIHQQILIIKQYIQKVKLLGRELILKSMSRVLKDSLGHKVYPKHFKLVLDKAKELVEDEQEMVEKKEQQDKKNEEDRKKIEPPLAHSKEDVDAICKKMREMVEQVKDRRCLIREVTNKFADSYRYDSKVFHRISEDGVLRIRKGYSTQKRVGNDLARLTDDIFSGCRPGSKFRNHFNEPIDYFMDPVFGGYDLVPLTPYEISDLIEIMGYSITCKQLREWSERNGKSLDL